MYLSILLLFLAVVSSIIGFLGIGYGPVAMGKTVFFILLVSLAICSMWEWSKKKSKHFDD